ncbi:MAG: hypothetical protein DMG70_25385 [Acidobacteria bacterium]|nr:MAG: hypothetical protein DMG70_25385 [Acidobacteriota bacterium]PYY09029.1 MAG: hypothetical protein DMG69_12465 [Acidobacteriota bacterium]
MFEETGIHSAVKPLGIAEDLSPVRVLLVRDLPDVLPVFFWFWAGNVVRLAFAMVAKDCLSRRTLLQFRS